MEEFLDSFRPYYIVGELGKGGQETQLRYLLFEARKKKMNTGVIIWETNNAYNEDKLELERAGVNVLSLPRVSLFRKIKMAGNFLKHNKASLLHSFSFYLNFYAYIIGKTSKVKTIGGIRSKLSLMYGSSGFFRFTLCCVFPRDKISNNKLYANDFNFPFKQFFFKRTQIVCNQIEMQGRTFEEPNICNGINSLSISRVSEEKDLFMLINVIEELVRNNVSIQHVHIGKGILIEECEKMIREKKLEKFIKFIGEQNDVFKYLTNCNLFIHTSRIEGYPNVCMEALASGRCVITTKCGDSELLIEEGITGFLVNIGDQSLMVERIIQLNNNLNRLVLIGEESFKMAKFKYKIESLLVESFESYKSFGCF